MELDRKERLFLHNQYRILDKLYPNQGFDRDADIVRDGYEGEYGRLAAHIYDRGLSVEECTFVRDVMSMYRRLRWAYEALSAEDRVAIPAQTIAFRGFDRDHATMLMAYARFLAGDGHSYPIIEEGSDGLNIDPPTVTRYRTMLDIWKLRHMETKERLTKDDILALEGVSTTARVWCGSVPPVAARWRRERWPRSNRW